MYSCSAAVQRVGAEEPDVVEELFLEVSEEVLHHRVVVAVAFAGHRLDGAGVSRRARQDNVLVLEALVRMHQRLLAVDRGVARAFRSEVLVSSRFGDVPMVYEMICRSKRSMTGER